MTDSVFITPNMPVRNFGCRGCIHEVSLLNPLKISTLAVRRTPNETQSFFKETDHFSAKDSLRPIPTKGHAGVSESAESMRSRISMRPCLAFEELSTYAGGSSVISRMWIKNASMLF